MKPNMY